MIVVYEFSVVVAFIKEENPVKKQEIKKEILYEHVDFFFSKFEKELKNNNGYFGGKVKFVILLKILYFIKTEKDQLNINRFLVNFTDFLLYLYICSSNTLKIYLSFILSFYLRYLYISFIFAVELG